MNHTAIKTFNGLQLGIDPSQIVPFEKAEIKNIVITINGQLAPKAYAKRIIFINDPITPVKGWI